MKRNITTSWRLSTLYVYRDNNTVASLCMVVVCAAHALASAATGPESESQMFEPAISGITVVSAQQQTLCRLQCGSLSLCQQQTYRRSLVCSLTRRCKLSAAAFFLCVQCRLAVAFVAASANSHIFGRPGNSYASPLDVALAETTSLPHIDSQQTCSY